MGCSSSTNVETIQAISSQRQLDNPFRISNRGLDSVDRYLTFTNNTHAKEGKLLAEFDLPKEGEQKKSQIWRLQYAERSRKTFRIKHQVDHLYLTLTKSKHLNEYFAQLAKLNLEQGKQNQIWSFGLGENNRFTIKIESSQEKILYLESPQAETFEEGHSTLFVCRPESTHQRRYLQFWKLSPVITEIPLPQYSIDDVLRYCSQKQIQLIKKFKGEIYTKNSPHYFQKIQQYATSSFPSSQMQPYFLTYPQDIPDIRCMLEIAKMLCKNVVVRSGGHQYCGLSSGGEDTIVLCMNKFDTLLLNQQGLAQVGPCVPLKRAVKAFKDWQISLPHGECPLVNIGGHGQTGGYGYFIRSFGIFIDYIQAFEIVLANGQVKKATRPLPNAVISNQEERFNLELFRGVLGGNAGSFGIVTKYFLKGIKDQDHPKSYGFSKLRFFDKNLLIEMMKIQKQWTQIIVKGQDNQKLKGLDLQLTIGQIYIQIFNFKRPMMLLQGVYSDPDKGVPYNNQFQKIFQKFSENQTLMQRMANTFLGRFKGQYPLSILQYKHVRKFPLMTLSGREFDLPYEKRCNITMGSLKDQFITQFVQQISYVADIQKKSLLGVSQMMFGGGAYKQKGKLKAGGLSITSIPQRDFVHSFGFDVFYNTLHDPDAKSKAKQLQQKMQLTVDKHYTTPSVGEKKFFWASFGDLDMTKQSVIKTFYNNMEQYEVLQKLKKKVDPQDIFHSPMTVKLPKD